MAYWLPAVSVLAMALVLVLLWPHNRRRGAHARSMPEAAASYVLLEGSYLVLPGNPLGNPWPGPGGGSLPEREDVTTRRLPAAEYTGLGIMSPWAPVPPGVPSNTLPNLAVRPVANVLTGLPPETIGITVACSAGLQRSGFRFEVPPGVETGLPAVVRFQVELDDKGDVIHLLADPGDNPASARILETAVSRGHGTRAGRGEVQVSWGK
ncbi:MAG: hypothetical protein WCI17_07000 [bacterium]